jgi:phosphoribosyl 1,2-cyclic phosphodiesterase
VRYGGNTSCVELRASDDTLLVLDAGTGMRRLGRLVSPDITRIDVLLTHLHLDHLQGLGFFAPLYQEGVQLHVWGPSTPTADLRSRLLRYMSPPLFPVRLRDVASDLVLHDVPRGVFGIGPYRIHADFVCHPGATVGYRVEEDGRSLAYIPDHEPALGESVFPSAREWTPGYGLTAGVDVLIHDCQYTAVEYPEHVGWGHSAIDHAVALGTLARVKKLVTFHHDPGHDDVMLDRMLDAAVAAAQPPFPVVSGTEGASFVVGE